VARYANIIDIRINGFNHVAVQDGISKDGVIHLLDTILIPPKSVAGIQYEGEEMELEEFMERLLPSVERLEL